MRLRGPAGQQAWGQGREWRRCRRLFGQRFVRLRAAVVPGPQPGSLRLPRRSSCTTSYSSILRKATEGMIAPWLAVVLAQRHYGLANYRTIEKSPSARPPVTGTERGVLNREGDTRVSLLHNSLPGIDSCCTVTPFP